MFKKSFLIFITILFAVYPTAGILAQANSSPNNNGGLNQNQNQEVVLESPQNNGDFLIPENSETAPDPAGTVPVEKKEGTLIENPAGTSPSDTSEETPEEPPATDDYNFSPTQYNEGTHGTVEKSKFNKSSGEMQVDNFTGAVTYTYDLDLPPGRNGMQPNLKLYYNSQLKNFSNIVGLGWNMDLIDIHRDFKYGNTFNPTTGNHNYYSLNIYGNNQPIFPKTLIDDYHGEYITDNSDFSKIEYKADDDSWEIIDKNGIKYILGTTADFRLQAPGTNVDPRYINKWLISEIRDTNDNFISFEYYKDSNQIYPKKITYTGYDTTPGNIIIKFQPFENQNLVQRTDVNTSYEYRINNEVLTKYLVNQIEIVVNNELKKKYQLNYSVGDNGTTSLLNAIQEIGIDNGQELSRPATTFEYTVKERAFVNYGNWKAPNFVASFMVGGSGSYDFKAKLVDLNGDGLVDISKSGGDTSVYHGENGGAYINNGINGWNETTDPNCILPINGLGSAEVDLNGDGLTDVVESYRLYNLIFSKRTFINKGNCVWEQTNDYLLPIYIYDYENNGDQGVIFSDINNDGFTDIVSGGNYINNGQNGWVLTNTVINPQLDVIDPGVRFADVNGDGFIDQLYNDSTYLNDGSGELVYQTEKWVTPYAFFEPIQNPQIYRDVGTRIADMNSDGLVDIVASNQIYLNNGVDNFVETTWFIPTTNGYSFVSGLADTGGRLADVNGDNLIDFISARYEVWSSWENPEGIKETWLNQPSVPNILKKVNNGYGKIDEFIYKTSANYINGQGIDGIAITDTDTAYVDSYYPTIHQSGTLKTGYFGFEYQERWITYVKPDLSTIPVGNNIISFRAKLSATNANGLSNLSFYNVTSSWDPQTVTWNTKPTTGQILCRREGLVNGNWTFYCHGPLDQNGIAIRAVPSYPTNNPSANLSNIEIRDLVYQTAEPYNPNQNLNNTVEVVNEIKTNNGDDGIKDYKYNDGTKTIITSKQTMPSQIILTEPQSWNNDWQTAFIAKAGQIFKVNITDDYNLAKVWISRYALGQQATNVTFFIATIQYDQQMGVYQPATILTSTTMPATNLCPPGSNPNDCPVTINFPTTVHLENVPHYWLGIIGDPYINVYFKYAHTNNSGAYNCSGEICNFRYFETDPQSYYYNYYYSYGDMHFQIGKQSYTTTRQNYEFSGFGKVEATNQDGYKNITYFHQGGGLDGSEIGEYQDSFTKRGRPFRTENYDNNGDLISQSINKWGSYDTYTTSTFAATSTFVYLEQSTNSLFNDSAEHKDTATVYTYDNNNGNLLAEEAKGEVTADLQTGEIITNIIGDEKLTTYEYATSPENLHILGAPKNKVVSDPNLTSQIHQDYYYDNLPLGQVEHLNVTKEDLPVQTIDYEYTYNDYGLVTQKKDPYDNTTTITYDQYNLYPETTTNPLNQTVETTYDLYTGQILESIDPNGLVTQNTYDALGRLVLVKTSDPANPTQLINREAYEYHDFDFPWWIKHNVYLDAINTVATYTYYDGFGRVIQEKKQAEGSNFSTVDYWYDARGNLERQTLPYFTQTSIFTARNENQPNIFYTYDALDRVLTVTNNLGTTTNTYNLWTTTVTDANGKSKNIYHNAHNKLDQVDEILNGQTYSTNYDYNYLDLITNITDTQGNFKNYVYDDLGRLTSQQEMHKATSTTYGTWLYQYDLNSNLTQKTDPKNQVVNYAYDDLNRILAEDYQETTAVDNSYVYDTGTNAIGRLTNVSRNTAPIVSTAYTYDILGRVLTETKDIKGRIFTISYTYNLSDNPLTITYPDNFLTRYVYNSVGQTNEVYTQELSQNEQQIVSNVDYSPLNQISKINYTNGTETNNTYDPSQLYRLSLKQTTKATTTLQNISYTYDPVGNITQITDTAPNQLAKTADYVYDDLYRLTNATITTSTVTTLTFSYDPIGNITNKSDLGNYSYANSNPYQANQINGINQTYDNNGNLTNDTLKTLAYDYQDRLISVSPVGQSTINYYYDHTKTRVAKYKPDTGAFKMYPNKYYEKSNDKETRYLFLNDLRLATLEKVGTTTSTYLNFSDHLNSSSLTTDGQGNITNLNDYLPYGSDRVNVKLGSFNPTYKFTDQESDQESGLYYYDARYYNQGIGRFIQVDPVSLALADDDNLEKITGQKLEQVLSNPQYLNNYSYSVNNPVKFVDADGKFPFLIVGVAVLAGVLFNNIHPAYAPTNNFSQAQQPVSKSFGDLVPRYNQIPSGIRFGMGLIGSLALNKGVSEVEKTIVYHGTSNKAVSNILKNGFNAIEGEGIHFTNTLNTAKWFAKEKVLEGLKGQIIGFKIPNSIINSLKEKGLVNIVKMMKGEKYYEFSNDAINNLIKDAQKTGSEIEIIIQNLTK